MIFERWKNSSSNNVGAESKDARASGSFRRRQKEILEHVIPNESNENIVIIVSIISKIHISFNRSCEGGIVSS